MVRLMESAPPWKRIDPRDENYNIFFIMAIGHVGSNKSACPRSPMGVSLHPFNFVSKE